MRSLHNPKPMSVYSLLRIIHGYWRWAVLVLAVMVFVRSLIGIVGHRGWSREDELTMRRFFQALDLQVFLGLVLYFFFSPFWPATYQTFWETMRSPVARFFGVEHETAMLIAAIAAHVGWDRAKVAATDTAKHRIVAIAMTIFFALLLWAIPWPWREVGRPLFRTTP